MDDEQFYMAQVGDIMRQFNPYTQKKCKEQIEYMLENYLDIDYHWIYTALKRKSVQNYNRYQFNLWTNPGFMAQVYEQCRRDNNMNQDDLEEFYEMLDPHYKDNMTYEQAIDVIFDDTGKYDSEIVDAAETLLWEMDNKNNNSEDDK